MTSKRQCNGDRRKSEQRKALVDTTATEKRCASRREYNRRANLLGLPNFLWEKMPRPAVAWFSPYVPFELILAAGVFPFRMMPIPSAIGRSYNCMHHDICPYVLNCLDTIVAHAGYLDGVVIDTNCDAMRRMYDAVRIYTKIPFVHILDVPRVVDGLRLQYFKEQVQELAQSLEKHFKVDLSHEVLQSAIKFCNTTRSLLAELSDRRKNADSTVSGSEVQNTVKRSMDTSLAQFNEKLKRFLESSSNRRSISESGPRVAIVGGYFDQEFITDAIDDYGGSVVYEQVSNGAIHFDYLVDENKEPFLALSERYLNKIPTARMVNNDKGYESLIKGIKEYQADGVIFYSLKFCDQNLIYYADLKKKLTGENIPFLFLESDMVSDNLGQIKTRIQTFLDMLV